MIRCECILSREKNLLNLTLLGWFPVLSTTYWHNSCNAHNGAVVGTSMYVTFGKLWLVRYINISQPVRRNIETPKWLEAKFSFVGLIKKKRIWLLMTCSSSKISNMSTEHIHMYTFQDAHKPYSCGYIRICFNDSERALHFSMHIRNNGYIPPAHWITSGFQQHR